MAKFASLGRNERFKKAGASLVKTEVFGRQRICKGGTHVCFIIHSLHTQKQGVGITWQTVRCFYSFINKDSRTHLIPFF